MRIIAGKAKGSQIFAPKGQETRPTQDRVRESLFNILQMDLPGAHVLDLFAGSGALALEALSRGAEQAVLVDSDVEAVACIRRNMQKLGFTKEATLLSCDWQAALRRMAGQGLLFDLVFLDPPYHRTDTGAICARLAQEGLLEEGALLVVEHQKGKGPTPPEAFRLREVRSYRDTEISFVVYQEGEEA